jgi:DNA-binding PucR family transcriptional regulator
VDGRRDSATVARLVEVDARTGSEHTVTLQAFERSGGSIKDTAKALGLHANTVRYRLARITEITGLGLADPDTVLAVALHFRAAP